MPARQTYGDTTLLREVIETIIDQETPSLLHTLHTTEMVIHNYKARLRILYTQIVKAAAGIHHSTASDYVQDLNTQMSTLAIRYSPSKIDSLMKSMGRLYFTE